MLVLVLLGDAGGGSGTVVPTGTRQAAPQPQPPPGGGAASWGGVASCLWAGPWLAPRGVTAAEAEVAFDGPGAAAVAIMVGKGASRVPDR